MPSPRIMKHTKKIIIQQHIGPVPTHPAGAISERDRILSGCSPAKCVTTGPPTEAQEGQEERNTQICIHYILYTVKEAPSLPPSPPQWGTSRKKGKHNFWCMIWRARYTYLLENNYTQYPWKVQSDGTAA